MSMTRDPRDPAPPSTRTRRSADEARNDILDAAQAAFEQGGPEAVRLKPIAQACGVTHSGVLYHFGSREGLLEALFQRAALALREDTLSAVNGAWVGGRMDVEELLTSVYERVADPSRATLLAYLLAHGRDPFPAANEQGLARIAQGISAFSSGFMKNGKLSDEDAAFGLELMALVMFGDLLVGDHVRARLRDEPVDEQRERFRKRFSALLLAIGGVKEE
ncbi:MAG: TetR/AcrR family transcriptional regulator [Myxococcales bacterium]|nr:TetR/AcrR family transcriptional regulator [Myxococcales bacterium]